jgi:fatty-acyl-CoA synthase
MKQGWIGNYSYFRARIYADAPAVTDVDRGITYTYGDLDTRANKLANLLKSRYGVVKGDRVAFISLNRIELIDAYYATGKLGAIFVPYNARLSAVELAQLISSETPKVVFFEDTFLDRAEYLLKNTPIDRLVVIKTRDPDSKYDEYDALLNESPDTPVSCGELTLNDIHLIIHTGGTTGLPKGGMLSHQCLVFNAFNEICTWGLTYSDKALIVLPLFHTGGWNLLTLPMLHAGGAYLSYSSVQSGAGNRIDRQGRVDLSFRRCHNIPYDD